MLHRIVEPRSPHARLTLLSALAVMEISYLERYEDDLPRFAQLANLLPESIPLYRGKYLVGAIRIDYLFSKEYKGTCEGIRLAQKGASLVAYQGLKSREVKKSFSDVCIIDAVQMLDEIFKRTGFPV